jgi:hypothetical protein
MQVFKTKWFTRFARKERISDKKLEKAIQEVEKGLIDGDLGSGLIKKRVSRADEGKRGGYRTNIVYRTNDRAIFVYGFPKSVKANLNALDLDGYQKLANLLLKFNDKDIKKALNTGELKEVEYHE